MDDTLTPRQLEIYEWLQRFIANNGRSPTYSEMFKSIGRNSRGTIQLTIDALAEKGYITRKGRVLDIRLTNKRYLYPKGEV